MAKNILGAKLVIASDRDDSLDANDVVFNVKTGEVKIGYLSAKANSSDNRLANAVQMQAVAVQTQALTDMTKAYGELIGNILQAVLPALLPTPVPTPTPSLIVGPPVPPIPIQ